MAENQREAALRYLPINWCLCHFIGNVDIGLSAFSGTSREPVTLADNDVFAGIRLALNDTQDTGVLAGIGYDLDTSEIYVNVEADRRLGDDYVLELRARFFTNADPADTSFAIENDGYLQLQLSRYF
jgi:hypothetical protein